jgi:hypothetical protein
MKNMTCFRVLSPGGWLPTVYAPNLSAATATTAGFSSAYDPEDWAMLLVLYQNLLYPAVGDQLSQPVGMDDTSWRYSISVKTCNPCRTVLTQFQSGLY